MSSRVHATGPPAVPPSKREFPLKHLPVLVHNLATHASKTEAGISAHLSSRVQARHALLRRAPRAGERHVLASREFG